MGGRPRLNLCKGGSPSKERLALARAAEFESLGLVAVLSLTACKERGEHTAWTKHCSIESLPIKTERLVERRLWAPVSFEGSDPATGIDGWQVANFAALALFCFCQSVRSPSLKKSLQ